MKQLPQSWIDAGQGTMSHSRLEKPPCLRMFEYLYLKDERKDIPVNVPAIAGGAAHDAIESVVCHGSDFDEAIAVAIDRLQAHQPTDDLDALKTAQYIDDIVPVVENGIAAVREFSDEKFEPEQLIEMGHKELKQTLMGFVDLTGEDCIVELKTKWNTFGPVKKDGERSVRQIKLPENPDPSHVRQVSIYWAATGKLPVLIYISTRGSVTFTSKNCELLSFESLSYHFNQILHNAIVWENLLSISTDPHVLKYWIQPNWDDFRWRFMPNNYLNQAKELWKL